MLNQSFRQVFVTNNPTLLADGSTVDNLAVGQVGIVDAKSFKGVSNPTYAKNKAIKIVHGTPDLSGNPLMDGTYDQNEYSKLILGKKITGFRAKAAQRGQHQIIAVGFSGDVTDTDTIFARPGEERHLYLTLTGAPIDILFSKQGITRHYIKEYPVNSDCTDVCSEVDRLGVAQDFVSMINADTQINRFVKASLVYSCDPALDAPDTQTVYKFQLTVPDTQNDISLGAVQAQYPGSGVKRVGTQGVNSIYEIQTTVNTTPAAFSNAGTIIIEDCPSCPSGYTAVSGGYIYTVKVADNGDQVAEDSVASTYGITGSETIARVNYENGISTYVLTSSTALSTGTSEVQNVVATGASAGTFTLTYDGYTTSAIAYNASTSAVQSALEALSNLNAGDVTVTGGPLPGTAIHVTFNKALGNVPAMTADSTGLTGGTATVTTATPGVEGANLVLLSNTSRTVCVLSSPSTTAWVSAGTLTQTGKTFSLTVGDDVCGNNRLTELQALYPDLVIDIADASGSCVHTYTTTVYSNAVEDGCGVEQLSWVRPPAFEGVQWKAAPDTTTPDGTVCLVGIRIEAAFVNRVTNECTFDYFPYDADTVHITASSFDPNYNDSPFQNEDWVVKQVQAVKYPSGFGAHVREDEKKSLSYQLKERSFDPVIREAQGYSFQADPNTYYDEYSLEYEFTTLVAGWGQKETYTYTQVVYFPEGYGKAYENAINGYLASGNIALDGAAL